MLSSITETTDDAAAPRVASVVRLVTPCIDDEMLRDLPDSEQKFYREARQQVQHLAKGRKKAAERRERDALAIESLANAMVDLGNYEPESFRDLPIADVAADAEVGLTQATRLKRDAYWLARDHVEKDLAKKAGETTYERDLRIANKALTSTGLASERARRQPAAEKPYSPRQARLVDEHRRQEEYLRRMSEEPRAQSHITVGHDEDGVVKTGHQSASDRFDKHGRGFVAHEPAWVGGSSTQANGGTCYQGEFAEQGKRSARSVMTQRYLAATAKAPGKRRKGISNKKVIQRIRYLDDVGQTPEEIAADSKVGESVSRVKGVLHAARNDTRHWTGDNNDRRHLHLKKWVALDQIHGNTRTDCREVIRGDKDSIFESWDEFNTFLNTLKVRPQQITYVRDDHYPERVTKPHLLWWLPDGAGVWYNESIGMAMFEGAAAALTIMAGCDIGGLANVGDIKQPTSPRCVTVDIETEHLPDLSELCKLMDVDLKRNLVVTMRQQSVAQMIDAGLSETQSQAFYTLSGKRGWEICDLWRGARDLRVNAGLDRRLLGEQLVDAMLADRLMIAELYKLRGAKREAAENTIRVAAKRVAESYGRGTQASGRGYDLQAAAAETRKAVAVFRETAPTDLTPEELRKGEIDAARSAGGNYSRRVRLAKSVRRVADAMLEISKTGAVPDVDAVSAITGMDPRTTDKHWPAAVALNAANAIVAFIMQVDATPAAAPAKCSSVWGVTGEGRSEKQASQHDEPCAATPAPSGETLTMAAVIPVNLLPHANALRPWNPASGTPHTGRAMFEFCWPGATLFRSTLGIREQARRRLRGRSENVPAQSSADVRQHADSRVAEPA
jgi:hypothetical protein